MLDKETAKRIMVMRVREWDKNVGGDEFFDSPVLMRQVNFAPDIDEFLQANPEAGLDHG